MTPSPDRIPAARGFSLIELLVVVVIIAVLALAVTLSVAGSADRQLLRETDRFEGLVHLACEKAEQSGREIGVDVGTGGFSFRQLAGAEWRDADGDALRERAWIDGLRVVLTRDGHAVELGARNAPPEIVCFSSGEMTPFVATFALGDAKPYRITGSDDGTTKRDRVEVRR